MDLSSMLQTVGYAWLDASVHGTDGQAIVRTGLETAT